MYRVSRNPVFGKSLTSHVSISKDSRRDCIKCFRCLTPTYPWDWDTESGELTSTICMAMRGHAGVITEAEEGKRYYRNARSLVCFKMRSIFIRHPFSHLH